MKNMKEGKTRTTVDVNRELWSWVKQQATAKAKKTSEIIEDLIREKKESQK